MTERAKAMLLVEPRHMSPTSLPIPDVDRGGWLAIEATGLSGLDVQAWLGATDLRYPLIPGHEVVGRIASAGPISICRWVQGRRRELDPLRGLPPMHQRVGELQPPPSGQRLWPATVHRAPALWGGLAEYLYLDPAARLHLVSDDIPPVAATFAHPPRASPGRWRRRRCNRGERLVMGPGPRGLSA